jgi:addiction module HigA family antidote
MSPIRPGEILLEDFMKPMGVSQTRLALDTGIPQSRIQAIVAGKRGITVDTAMRFAAYFGVSAEFWLNCQTTYDLDMAVYSGKHDEIAARVHPRSPTACAVSARPTA